MSVHFSGEKRHEFVFFKDGPKSNLQNNYKTEFLVSAERLFIA